MNKMTIIQLLNKIANGEEVPKKFIWDDNEYYLHFNKCYRCRETSRIFEEDFILENLNEEVEIIEEEKKIPEKLNYPHIEIESSADDEIRDYLYKVKDKFDEIIDYLKSKEE